MQVAVSEHAKHILSSIRPANKLRDIISEIAKAKGLDLSKLEASTRIDNEPYQRLCIENVGGNVISVAHYFEMNGDLVPDPDMTFLVLDGNWYPLSFQNQINYSDSVNYDDNGAITQVQTNIKSMVSFTKEWANNIKAQGYLEAARK